MIVFREYPYFSAETDADVREQLRQICNTRKDDVQQVQNLINLFVSGRKTGKIPTSSSDVDAKDRVGDISYDSSYMYILIDNGGAAEWRRASLASW